MTNTKLILDVNQKFGYSRINQIGTTRRVFASAQKPLTGFESARFAFYQLSEKVERVHLNNFALLVRKNTAERKRKTI